jgi:hypothetical protein
MLGVVRYPYMPTDVDRYIQQVAIEMGRGQTFNKAPVGVYFGSQRRGYQAALGSGYERVDPVMPYRPFVPAGAPGELRLDAKKSDIIPDYPY